VRCVVLLPHNLITACMCVCVCVCVGYCAVPTANVAHLQAQCVLSNDKKLAAKRVSELSSELFFSIFVRVCSYTLVSFSHTL